MVVDIICCMFRDSNFLKRNKTLGVEYDSYLDL